MIYLILALMVMCGLGFAAVILRLNRIEQGLQRVREGAARRLTQ
jgi:hypothetical protein